VPVLFAEKTAKTVTDNRPEERRNVIRHDRQSVLERGSNLVGSRRGKGKKEMERKCKGGKQIKR
jgi:hypothetical protein